MQRSYGIGEADLTRHLHLTTASTLVSGGARWSPRFRRGIIPGDAIPSYNGEMIADQHPPPATLDASLRQWLTPQLQRLTGAEEFTSSALRVEASFRQFYRIVSTQIREQSFIVMAAPPAQENNAAFIHIAEVFRSGGIGVPEILAQDTDSGWFLLSDLGSWDLEAVYASDRKELALEAAIDTLIRIQAIEDRGIAPYTVERFADELGIFSEWFVGDMLNLALPHELEDIFGQLIEQTQDQPQCCIHRDFHCRNLLYDATGNLGVVDFQDALIGPVSYDLASLLRDCYYKFSEPEIHHWCSRYLALTPIELSPSAFARALDWTAAQRQLKAIGIFARLAARDGKKSHLAYIEPVLARLVGVCLRYPDLQPLGNWLDGRKKDAHHAVAARNG